MSKIEEMAKFWIADRLLGGNESSLRTKEFRELGMDAYTNGANAVLNEILRYIGNHSSFESDILKDKLKELKGEEV